MKQWKSVICLLLCVAMLGGCSGGVPAMMLPDDGYFDIGVDHLPCSDE